MRAAVTLLAQAGNDMPLRLTGTDGNAGIAAAVSTGDVTGQARRAGLVSEAGLAAELADLLEDGAQVTCVECGAEVAAAPVCRKCGAPVAAQLGMASAGSPSDGRRRRPASRILGVTIVVILNVLALWLGAGFVVVYVTQGSPAQLGADHVPLGATVFMATVGGSVPATTLVWVGYLWRRARRRRIGLPESPALPPGCVTIGKGQGAFLRADDQGLLIRHVPWGRVRRIGWTEISHFTDGKQVKEGTAYWLLVIVLHTGKRVVPVATHQWFRQPAETVKDIRELAERHGIPADLTGLPPESKGFGRNLLGI
jgi:hypothetical protein